MKSSLSYQCHGGLEKFAYGLIFDIVVMIILFICFCLGNLLNISCTVLNVTCAHTIKTFWIFFLVVLFRFGEFFVVVGFLFCF